MTKHNVEKTRLLLIAPCDNGAVYFTSNHCPLCGYVKYLSFSYNGLALVAVSTYNHNQWYHIPLNTWHNMVKCEGCNHTYTVGQN